MPDQEQVDESYSVLGMKRVHFPEYVSEWVFKESGDILEGSPFLCHVSWLSCRGHEFSKITLCFLG